LSDGLLTTTKWVEFGFPFDGGNLAKKDGEALAVSNDSQILGG